jgi:hypothetical protein
MLAWVSIYWGNFGKWSINEANQLQINTIRKFTAATKITITPIILPVLQIDPGNIPFDRPIFDYNGLPCQSPYFNGSQIMYPAIKHTISLKITNISDVECKRFRINLGSDWSKVKNPIISSLIIGSATINGSSLDWSGSLSPGLTTSMTIQYEVTRGGISKVDISGSTPNFVTPNLGSDQNQAYVPLNYQISATIDSDSYAYSESPINSVSINCNLPVKSFMVYSYSSSVSASNSIDDIAGAGTTIKPMNFAFSTPTPSPYDYNANITEPITANFSNLRTVTNYLNSARFPLGYFYSAVYQGAVNTNIIVCMLTYYDLIDSLNNNQFKIIFNPILQPEYSQITQYIPDLIVYPVIGDTYTAYGTCLDVYTP